MAGDVHCGRWLISACFAMLCLGCAAVPARAANNCPWMNEATASSLLEGNAIGLYTGPEDGKPALCVFTQQRIQGKRSLEIRVRTVADPHAQLTKAEQACGADQAPLHAIGNEAISCNAEVRPGQRGERAVGRVRNQIFAILLFTSVKNDPVLTRDALEAKIYTVSEQVAGNLF